MCVYQDIYSVKCGRREKRGGTTTSFIQFRTYATRRHRDCNRHHAAAIIIAMATFQHHFLFVSLVFYRLANAQITTHKKKAQMDDPPTRRTLVARVRPPSVRPAHFLHFNLPDQQPHDTENCDEFKSQH